MPGPHATLKAELAAKIAAAERQDVADPDHYRGEDWWQLSEAEQDVFDLQPAQWPRLILTFYCFQAFTGEASTAEFDDGLVAAAREQFPQWYEEGEDADRRRHFLAFAAEFGGVANRDAFATLRKQEAWDLHSGVLTFSDGSF